MVGYVGGFENVVFVDVLVDFVVDFVFFVGVEGFVVVIDVVDCGVFGFCLFG